MSREHGLFCHGEEREIELGRIRIYPLHPAACLASAVSIYPRSRIAEVTAKLDFTLKFKPGTVLCLDAASG